MQSNWTCKNQGKNRQPKKAVQPCRRLPHSPIGWLFRPFRPRQSHFKIVIPAITILWFASTVVFGQELPKKIRGYTVHREKVTLSGPTSTTRDTAALVTVGEAAISNVELSGLTFELPLSFHAPQQSGKVDFLAFHDFRVNGIPVTIGEYDQAFSFKKNDVVELRSPVSVFLPTTRLIQAAWLEMRDSKEDWKVEGRVFVFGRFRKFGFYHKRVIPLNIELFIKNPVRK